MLIFLYELIVICWQSAQHMLTFDDLTKSQQMLMDHHHVWAQYDQMATFLLIQSSLAQG
jgi:hypothetical protein